MKKLLPLLSFVSSSFVGWVYFEMIMSSTEDWYNSIEPMASGYILLYFSFPLLVVSLVTRLISFYKTPINYKFLFFLDFLLPFIIINLILSKNQKNQFTFIIVLSMILIFLPLFFSVIYVCNQKKWKKR